MFKSSPLDMTTKSPAETIIGPSVKVDGDFTGQGNIIVEGIVHGNVKTDHDVRVGEQAKIQAHIRAANASVAGEVRGNIKVKDRLELASTAKVFGDIETKVIQVASGAVINGKLTMTKDLPPDFAPPPEEPLKKKFPKERMLT
ncbi:polymer-forming cytoskeletal protein [Candidatus Uhrbacteria bacterium]|nr:polymer-forming cytoskeletal protein [Candidatus Uhrbacteria bacterium]